MPCRWGRGPGKARPCAVWTKHAPGVFKGSERTISLCCPPIFADPDVRVRASFRLTPLALCIGLSLSPHLRAQKMQDDFSLCPLTEAVPAFADVPATGITLGKTPLDRAQSPTDIEGDTLSGTDVAPQFQGNVALRRGTSSSARTS